MCPQTNPSCVGPSSYFTKTFEKGKRYLLRLINASTDAGFIFSIDGHILKVISSDFVPIHPYTTNSLHIAIGKSKKNRLVKITNFNQASVIALLLKPPNLIHLPRMVIIGFVLRCQLDAAVSTQTVQTREQV